MPFKLMRFLELFIISNKSFRKYVSLTVCKQLHSFSNSIYLLIKSVTFVKLTNYIYYL